jgi:hypothetical protein
MKTKTFIVLVVIFFISYFSQGSYRAVNDIHPAVLQDPKQTSISSTQEPIKFTKNDWDYHLTPTHEYEISGLVVSRMDYRWFSINKTDEVFFLDLCMLWGQNAASKVYKNDNLSFKQDSRFCWYSWTGNLEVRKDQISNTHLVVYDNSLGKKLSKIKKSDQVKIKGKLVNIKAQTDNPGKYEGGQFALNTSTVREDDGAGACEVLYVESFKILKRGHPVAGTINTVCIYGLFTWFGWVIASLFKRKPVPSTRGPFALK